MAAREFGLNPAYYKDKAEELLGELMLREMGDVSGPGSLDPEHGAYRGCDAPIERYPYNPSP